MTGFFTDSSVRLFEVDRRDWSESDRSDGKSRVTNSLVGAAITGRSLQEYLRDEVIELARRPDPEALLVRIHERERRTGSRLPGRN